MWFVRVALALLATSSSSCSELRSLCQVTTRDVRLRMLWMKGSAVERRPNYCHASLADHGIARIFAGLLGASVCALEAGGLEFGVSSGVVATQGWRCRIDIRVENPKAPVWHEKKRYPKFYVLPCLKSLSNSYFSEIFSSKPVGKCSILEKQKSDSRLFHRICGECFDELVTKKSVECYCVGLDGPPESNFTKIYKRRRNGTSKGPVQLIDEETAEETAEEADAVEDKKGGPVKEEDHVKMISEMEERLRDLEEDVDAGHNLASQLTISYRKATDELNDAKTTILNSRMLHEHGNPEIGVKVLGQINTEGWWEECKHKFGGDEERFSTWLSRFENLLRTQTFNPIKVVPDGKGGSKNVVDEDDEELTASGELWSFSGECCRDCLLGVGNLEPEWTV